MGIRTIHYRETLDAAWEELTYTHARLVAAPLAVDLVPSIERLLARVDTVAAGQRAAARGELVAQAAVDAADEHLDEAVHELGLALLRIAGGERTSARFRRYFAAAPIDVIRLGLASEVAVVRPWIAALRAEAETSLRAFADRLERDLVACDAALAARALAAGASTEHRVREVVCLIDDINAARSSLHEVLTTRARERQLPLAYADRFFRKRGLPVD